jgi:membrane fusion protein (multidrug efflux system)
MGEQTRNGLRSGVRSATLIAVVLGVGGGLTAWKLATAQDAQAAAAMQQEPMEVVSDAVAATYEHREMTTSIGTVLATRSVTLRNEIAGTVAEASLVPGRIVEEGAVLVALDVSVERAELRALAARAELARATLVRYERMAERQAASAIELDNARAEHDIALADIARVEAIIARKTIRAPFRARVGLSDVHRGQFLESGTLLTTLQGVADAVDIDFSVSQIVAAGLAAGDVVEVVVGQDAAATFPARVTAVDSRVDPTTRNALVRARIERTGGRLTPGASVRVRVPVGAARSVVVVPASSLRRGPAGDHVFVLDEDAAGTVRAYVRRVEAGPVLGRDAVVLSGLEAGERVATSGSFKLREGVLVMVAGGGAGSDAAGEPGSERGGDAAGVSAGGEG